MILTFARERVYNLLLDTLLSFRETLVLQSGQTMKRYLQRVDYAYLADGHGV